MKGWLLIALVAACQDRRVPELEKRVALLERELQAQRAYTGGELRTSIADKINEVGETLSAAGLIDADWKGIARWWCRADGARCGRAKDSCGEATCFPHRIAYCGGREHTECFSTGLRCAENNMARVTGGKYDSTVCLGVE